MKPSQGVRLLLPQRRVEDCKGQVLEGRKQAEYSSLTSNRKRYPYYKCIVKSAPRPQAGSCHLNYL